MTITYALEDSRGELRNDAHLYGKMYKLSSIFMIKKRHPDLDLKGNQFDDLLGMESDEEDHATIQVIELASMDDLPPTSADIDASVPPP